MLVLYLLERTQQWLPFNPQKFSAVPQDLAFNTAASFTTNTNWQFYTGEQVMSCPAPVTTSSSRTWSTCAPER